MGETFFACAAYNFVVVYDWPCTRALAVLRAHSHKVTAVAAARTPDGEVLLSGGRDKAVIAWSVTRHSVLKKQKKLPGDVTAIALCPHDAEVAMVALSTGGVSLWKWCKGAIAGYVMTMPLLCAGAPSCKQDNDHSTLT
jgi:WD40 repeat protein